MANKKVLIGDWLGDFPVHISDWSETDELVDPSQQPIIPEYTGELYVDTNGNDTIGNGSLRKPFATLQKVFDVYESCITIDNWYMMRVVRAFPGIYVGNVTIPPGRFTIYGQNVIIQGNITIKRSDVLQNTSVDPLSGIHTDRMRHTIRFEGGAGQENSNYDGGVFVYGNIICTHLSDSGVNTLEIYARNMVCSGIFTPNDSTTNPTRCSGALSMYFHSCKLTHFHSPISLNHTLSMWDCRLSGSLMSHPLGTATYGRIQFDSIRDTAIATLAFANGEVGVYSSSDRQALCNVRFNSGTAFTAASATTLKVDANTYVDLVALGLVMTNITLSRIDGISGIAYVPGASASWASPAPTTAQQALDRMAALLKTLNGGVAIP